LREKIGATPSVAASGDTNPSDATVNWDKIKNEENTEPLKNHSNSFTHLCDALKYKQPIGCEAQLAAQQDGL